MRTVPHNRCELAVHELREGSGPGLLCLHELEGDGEQWREDVQDWPGRAVAVDFAGHGASGWLDGGGYAPELFAGDADVVLASLESDGPVAVVGAGIGAYVALLLAGSRHDVVAVAGLLPGRGLEGGGAGPGDRPLDQPAGAALLDLADRAHDTTLATDPLVEMCLTDLRPTDYAATFAGAAHALVLGEDGAERPPWWVEVRTSDRAVSGPADGREMVTALASRMRGADG